MKLIKLKGSFYFECEDGLWTKMKQQQLELLYVIYKTFYEDNLHYNICLLLNIRKVVSCKIDMM